MRLTLLPDLYIGIQIEHMYVFGVLHSDGGLNVLCIGIVYVEFLLSICEYLYPFLLHLLTDHDTTVNSGPFHEGVRRMGIKQENSIFSRTHLRSK